MAKQKYYSLKKIDSTDCKYRIIVSERSPGKSYAVKLKVLKYCWETKRKFAYIRRTTDERTANAVIEYFENMEVNKDGKREIFDFTKGECDCIDVYAERIFLCKTQEDGTKKKILMVGHAFALVKEGRYKSHAYEDYDYAIFEEFITDMGYIPREMKHFKNLISTIFRKRKAVVYMIGNTLTPVCPYFNEWQIDILKIKQGTIEVYNYHIY